MEPVENIDGNNEPTTLPYLLFTVGANTYGISSEFVRSIETLGEVTPVTGSEYTVRGGVFYQDDFIYLTELRKLFGLDSQIEEFDKLVQPDQRIRDHENWVSALEKSVREHTEFTLTDDPHKCAFGKWFYSFTTDNTELKHHLQTIESPHESIHNTAKTVKDLMHKEEFDLAMSAIDELRDTHYKTTIGILSGLRQFVIDSMKELYIVIDSTNGLKGIIVDTVVGVEFLESTLPMPKNAAKADYVNFLGQRTGNDKVVIVLNNAL